LALPLQYATLAFEPVSWSLNMKRELKRLISSALLVAVATSCADPTLRDVAINDTFVQGGIPHYLDVLVVIDQSPSTSNFPREMRDSLLGLMGTISANNSRFRVGVTSASVRADINRPSSFGWPAFGLEGTFTTSGNNTATIQEGPGAVNQFKYAVNKIAMLSSIRSNSGSGGPFDKFRRTDEYISYFGSGAPTVLDIDDTTYGVVSPGESNPSGLQLSQLPSDGSYIQFGVDDESHFTAISRANQLVAGIFGARPEVDVKEIPLAVLVLSDGTYSNSDPTFGTDVNAAKNFIRGLRNHTVQGQTKPNVAVFGVFTGTSFASNVVNALLSGSDALPGHSYSNAGDFGRDLDTIASQLGSLQTRYCLSQRPRGEITVTLNEQAQTSGTDYNYDSNANCLDFVTAPAEGATVMVSYQY
jgi:hypothetical protein